MAAYINQVDVKNKNSQQKDGGQLSSREYLLPLKDGLKSDGMINEMVRVQRQSYDGAIEPVEDRRGSHPPSKKRDSEVIRVQIYSYNPAISHYKRKNALYKQYRNPQ